MILIWTEKLSRLRKLGDDFNDPITRVLSVEEIADDEVSEDPASEDNVDSEANNVSFDAFF